LREVAKTEGMDGKPIENYLGLVREKKFNLRACLQSIESGELMD
jgi:hypothetical protein